MKNRSSGISLSTVLVAIFFVLKMVGVISWSWIWIFSPWWISILLCVSIIAIASLNDWLDSDYRF